MGGLAMVQPGGVWRVAHGGAARVGNPGDPCCCTCLSYAQALTKNTLIATFSAVQFDFSCFTSDSSSGKLLTAGLNATWAVPKISQNNGFITFGLSNSAIATMTSYPVARFCNPIFGEFLGNGNIQATLRDNGDWSVNVGAGVNPAGRLFFASGGQCLPTSVPNSVVGFGFNFLQTVIDVGRLGSGSFGFQ